MILPVTKPEFIYELGSVNISPIKSPILRISDQVWDKEDERKENKFFCFHHTKHIIFRFIEGNRDPRNFYSQPIWYPWQDKLLPILEQVVASYRLRQNVYPKVMLARLAAGYKIDRHTDEGGSNLFTRKIHIPIQTNDKVRFIIKDRAYHLREGWAYEVNNTVPHAVENLGASDRIHLIFELFDGAGVEANDSFLQA